MNVHSAGAGRKERIVITAEVLDEQPSQPIVRPLPHRGGERLHEAGIARIFGPVADDAEQRPGRLGGQPRGDLIPREDHFLLTLQ